MSSATVMFKSANLLRWAVFVAVCVRLVGCASTIDGPPVVTSAVDSGIHFDAGMISDVPVPCAASAMTCATVIAPRPTAPLTTATTSSQRPALHWQLATGTDGAIVQICHDRACTIVEQTLVASGYSAAPASSLAAGVHFWRLFGRHGATMGTVAGPTWEFFVGHRSTPVDTSCGSVLDVNGDGYADVAVRDYDGTAYLYLGGASGLSTVPSAWPGSGSVLANLHAVASVGDVNGDGYADLLVGSNLYFGSASGLNAAAMVSVGSDPYFIAGAGDMNGDGYADIATVTATEIDAGTSGSSIVQVFLGSASGPGTPISLAIPGGGTDFPFVQVAGAGDVNGDGYADLAVVFLGETSAPYPPSAYVYMGSANGPSATPMVLNGPGGDTLLAAVATGAGDVNGDGYSDLVAFTDNNMVPAVYVYAGSASGLATVPTTLTTPAGAFGGALASAGDVNGDGFTDLIVGNPSDPQAFVYLGSASGLGDPVMLTEDVPMGALTEFGGAMAGAGDVNGDGYADIVIADDAAGSPPIVGGPGPGAAYVYLGRAGGLNTTATVLSAPANVSYFGTSVALGW